MATANGSDHAGRTTLPDLAIEWMSPYRTQRLYKLLSAPQKFTPADMLTIQTDVVSALRSLLRRALRLCRRPHARRLATCEGRRRPDAQLGRPMDTDSPAADHRGVLPRSAGGVAADDRSWEMTGRTYRWFMKSGMAGEHPDPPAAALVAVATYANYDALLTAAVEAAGKRRQRNSCAHFVEVGPSAHRVDVKHPFWSNFPILKTRRTREASRCQAMKQTIKQVRPHFGPSERFTVDFADLDGSTLNIVNGQSGDIFDEHYNDQWDAYYHGRTFSCRFRPKRWNVLPLIIFGCSRNS